jgi:hypothetical protein
MLLISQKKAKKLENLPIQIIILPNYIVKIMTETKEFEGKNYIKNYVNLSDYNKLKKSRLNLYKIGLN